MSITDGTVQEGPDQVPSSRLLPRALHRERLPLPQPVMDLLYLQRILQQHGNTQRLDARDGILGDDVTFVPDFRHLRPQ